MILWDLCLHKIVLFEVTYWKFIISNIVFKVTFSKEVLLERFRISEQTKIRSNRKFNFFFVIKKDRICQIHLSCSSTSSSKIHIHLFVFLLYPCYLGVLQIKKMFVCINLSIVVLRNESARFCFFWSSWYSKTKVYTIER